LLIAQHVQPARQCRGNGLGAAGDQSLHEDHQKSNLWPCLQKCSMVIYVRVGGQCRGITAQVKVGHHVELER
jgi:hypothetical protein